MHIESLLTKQDYWRINYFGFGISKYPFFIFSALLLLTAVFLTIEGKPREYLIIFLLAYIALYVLVFIAFVVSFLLNTRQNSKIAQNMFVQEGFDFEDEGVRIESPNSNDFKKWSAFIKWRKVKDYYLLYIARPVFYVIKGENIPLDEIPKFESLLINKIGKISKW